MHLSAIFHFFEINDYANLKRRNIKRFLPEDESDFYSGDRTYSVTEIEKILDKCDVRDRVAVLFMLSTACVSADLESCAMEHLLDLGL